MLERSTGGADGTLNPSFWVGDAVKSVLSARELLEAIERELAGKPRLAARGRTSARALERFEPGDPGALQTVVRLLCEHRRYLHAAVYLNGGTRLVRHAAAGAVSGCVVMDLGQGVVGRVAQTGAARVVGDVKADRDYYETLPQTRSELVEPIRIGSRVLGVIDVESERRNAFRYPDRVLLGKVAQAMAKFLTGRGKYLLLEARETAADHLRPRFESHARQHHFAVAGEKSHR